MGGVTAIVVEIVGHPRLDGPISVRFQYSATIDYALQRVGLSIEPGWSVGVWSHEANLSYALHDGDRIEFYEPLRFDPKISRRLRVKKVRQQ